MQQSARVALGSGSLGTTSNVRRSNLALVLNQIAQASSNNHLTRAQISVGTGLTKASVSSLVLELLNAGLVREIGVNPQGERGRPGIELELNPNRAVMGMEINVDYIAVGVMDLSGNLLVHELRESRNSRSSSEQVMVALTNLAASTRRTAGVSGVQILGGGLAVPGLVDPAANKVVLAPNLGWTDVGVDLESLLPDTPLGVNLSNEANAAALAELRHRPTGKTNFFFVSGEAGVGGGMVIDSELFAGPEGHAGEVGHMVVDPDGVRCSCGGTGCLETVAGQDAMFATAGIGGRGTRSETMSILVQALAAGEPKARLAVDRAGHYLGVALASTAMMVNVSLIVLGGHFAVLDPWMRAPLLVSLEKYAPGRFGPEQVIRCTTGQYGALLGAAGSVVSSLLDAPHRLFT